MIKTIYQRRFSAPARGLVAVITSALVLTLLPVPPAARASVLSGVPRPGVMIPPSRAFEPAMMKGIRVFPEKPLAFEFLVDRGQSALGETELRQESYKLIKFFLAVLTVPEEDLWVNLSPDGQDRIVPEAFSETALARELLAQDYVLKQLTATLMYPEETLGARFWERVYQKIADAGISEVPATAMSRVWIVPERAEVFVRKHQALVIDSHLTVMLESDYEDARAGGEAPRGEEARISGEVMRELILPELEREINEGENFAPLRQAYHALILATWYKRKLKESFLGQHYIGRNKITGIDDIDASEKEAIYRQYLATFEQGVYDLIREEYDPHTREFRTRRYISGGLNFAKFGRIAENVFVERTDSAALVRADLGPEIFRVRAGIVTDGPDAERLSRFSDSLPGKSQKIAPLKMGALPAALSFLDAGQDPDFAMLPVTLSSGAAVLGNLARRAARPFKRMGFGSLPLLMLAFVGLNAVVLPQASAADFEFVNGRLVGTLTAEDVAPPGFAGDFLERLRGEMFETDPDFYSDTVYNPQRPLWGEEGAWTHFNKTVTDLDGTSPEALEAFDEGNQFAVPEGVFSYAFLTRELGFADSQIPDAYWRAGDGPLRLQIGGSESAATASGDTPAPAALDRTPAPPTPDPGVSTEPEVSSPAETETVPVEPRLPDVIIPTPREGFPVLGPDSGRAEDFGRPAEDVKDRTVTDWITSNKEILGLGAAGALTALLGFWGWRRWSRRASAEAQPRRRPSSAPSGLDEVIHGLGEDSVITTRAGGRPSAANDSRVVSAEVSPRGPTRVRRVAGGLADLIAMKRETPLPINDRVAFNAALEEMRNNPSGPEDAPESTRPDTETVITLDRTDINDRLRIPLVMDGVAALSGGILGSIWESYFPGSGWMPAAYGAVAGAFLSRTLFTAQLFLHERFHLRAAAKHGLDKKSVYSPQNRRGHLSWGSWMKNLLPGYFGKTRTPFVVMPSTDSRREKLIAKSGFFFSGLTAAALAATGFGAGYALQGGETAFLFSLLSLGSSLPVLLASYRQDFRRGPVRFAQGDSCHACGNFGYMWFSEDGEFFPEWAQGGLKNLLNLLVTRGGQSAGLVTVVETEDGADEGVVIWKVVREKRGARAKLIPNIISGFRNEATLRQKRVRFRVKQVMNLMGHVRFATVGAVTREATHPHLGPLNERMNVWKLEDGRFVQEKDRQILTAVTENGDHESSLLYGRQRGLNDLRKFFMKALDVEKIPGGDAPIIALQNHFNVTRGNWEASVRYAYYFGLMANYEEAMGKPLTGEFRKELASVFEKSFIQMLPVLSRPDLSGAEKSFEDLYPDEEAVRKHPSLKLQKEVIELFARMVKTRVKSQLAKRDRSSASDWRKSEEEIDAFVDLAVERFFTGSLSQAVREFQRDSKGAGYGIAVQHSTDNGVAFFSQQQAIALGFSREGDFMSWASDLYPLMVDHGGKSVEDAIVLDMSRRGEVAYLSMPPQGEHPFELSLFNGNEGRHLNKSELVGSSRSFPLGDNPKISPLPEYDPKKNRVDQELEWTAKAMDRVKTAWENPESAERQAGDKFTRHLVANYAADYIRKHSEAYTSAFPNLVHRLGEIPDLCGGAVCNVNPRQLVSRLTDLIENDTAIRDLLMGGLDEEVARVSDRWAAELMGTGQEPQSLNPDDLLSRVRELNTQLESLRDKTLDDIVLYLAVELEEKARQNQNMDQESRTPERLDNFGDQIIRIPSSRGGMAEVNEGVIESVVAKLAELYPYREGVSRRKNHLVIAGYESSHWMGENLVKILKLAFPDLEAEAVSANQLLRDPRSSAIGPETLLLIASKSGSTYPSLNLADLRETVPRMMAMTGRLDTMLGISLGEDLSPEAPLSGNILTTGNFYLSESETVSEVEVYLTQIYLAMHVFRRVKETLGNKRPFGMTLDDDVMDVLERLEENILPQAQNILGRDTNGREFQTATNRELRAAGSRLAGDMKEGLITRYAPVGMVLGFVGVAGAGPANLLASAFLPEYWTGIGSTIATRGTDALFFSLLGLSSAWFYRYLKGHREEYFSRLGVPTYFLLDLPHLNKMADAFLGKLTSMAPGSMAVPIRNADPTDEAIATVGFRQTRGARVITGVPNIPELRGDVEKALMQLKAIRNNPGAWIGLDISAGPEVLTIGHGLFRNPDARHRHINLGRQLGFVARDELMERYGNETGVRLYEIMLEEGYIRADNGRGLLLPSFTDLDDIDGFRLPGVSPQIRKDVFEDLMRITSIDDVPDLAARLNVFMFDGLDRHIASKVLFNEMTAVASRITRFWELWDRSTTFTITRIHSTQSPPGNNNVAGKLNGVEIPVTRLREAIETRQAGFSGNELDRFILEAARGLIEEPVSEGSRRSARTKIRQVITELRDGDFQINDRIHFTEVLIELLRIPALREESDPDARVLLESLEAGANGMGLRLAMGYTMTEEDRESIGLSVIEILSAKPLPSAVIPADPDVGGIDFNPENLRLNETGDAFNFQIPLPEGVPSPASFTPVIHQILPVTNVYQLLGLTGHESLLQLTRSDGPADG